MKTKSDPNTEGGILPRINLPEGKCEHNPVDYAPGLSDRSKRAMLRYADGLRERLDCREKKF